LEILDHIATVGLTPAAYLEIMTRQAEGDPTTVTDEAARKNLEFTKLNLHRTGRISRTWKPSAELAAAQEVLAAALDAEFVALLTDLRDGLR